MISEGSCDTEDWSNDAENSASCDTEDWSNDAENSALTSQE